VLAELVDALRFRLEHADLSHYNAVQKTLYIGIILIGILQVISGIAIWKPVQFSSLIALFYDFQGARLVHFIGMSAIVLFLLVHVTLALLVPKTLGSDAYRRTARRHHAVTVRAAAIHRAAPDTSP
jgi:thiosulfate reductase cytochrome b subunit